MDKKLNGFNNGRDTTDGIGGKPAPNYNHPYIEDKLILLKRINPTIYEVHKGEISQDHNLILSTKDLYFAERLVNGYNTYLNNASLLDLNE